jgi:hypothetical protein
MTSPSSPRQSPLSRRSERFYAQLAATAGTNDSPKLILRAQQAWPWLPTGRIADARLRIWLVPSLKTDDRRYHVCLDTGDCYYFDAAAQKHACPHRLYGGKSRCCHHEAAVRAEVNMFGGDAAEYFAPKPATAIWQENPPEREAGEAAA